MNVTAVVSVSLKKSILDPQGRTILSSLRSLGYGTVQDVRTGKQFVLQLTGSRDEVEAQLQEFASDVLANPVTETVSWELTEAS